MKIKYIFILIPTLLILIKLFSLVNFYRYQSKRRELFIKLLDINTNTKLDASKVEEIENVVLSNDLVRKKILIPVDNNENIPCYLFLNPNQDQQPAILVPPGHESGIVQTAGLEDSYQNSNAQELAKAGYVTLSCENRGQGELEYSIRIKPESRYKLNQENEDLKIPDDYESTVFLSSEISKLPVLEQRYYSGLRTADLHRLLNQKSYNSIILKDNQFALDYLESLSFVNPNKIGVAGISQGGETAFYLAAIDSRVKSVVVMGWLTNWTELLDDNDDWRIPTIDKHFSSMDEIGLLLIPRNSLFHNGLQEGVKIIGVGFPSDTASIIFNHLKNYYFKALVPANTSYYSLDIEHEFVNQLAINFFDDNLKNSTISINNNIVEFIKIFLKNIFGEYDYKTQ